jgi:DNA-binding response OmpR family regulator
MSGQDSHQKVILVIDDEVNLQQLLKVSLNSNNYHVEIANNGIEGLEKLKTVKPDLIILDMNMPRMGGVEFYEMLCDGNTHPKYPVLVLTARANMEQLFKEVNIDGFMPKPFEISELLHEIERIIKKNSESGFKITSSGFREPKKICIVEKNPETLNKIGSLFLAADYVVIPAQNGTEGIERIAQAVPDIALVQLGLDDISGDLVILRLKLMDKTKDVKYILFTEKNAEKASVTKRIGEKEGIGRFIESTNPQELLKAVNEIIGTH